MARRGPGPSPSEIERFLKWVFDVKGRDWSRARLDPQRLAVLVLIVVVLLAVVWWNRPRTRITPAPPTPGEGFLACSWNVENFFDDRDDPRNHDSDEDWFGRNPAAFEEKVEKLADALLLQNQGRGPDVLAMVEVESLRCVERLRDVLNSHLPPTLQYAGIVQRDNPTGRKFAPAVLTRFAVRDDLTRASRDFGGRRILEAHLEAEGAPLVLLVSHWTSRIRGDTEGKRSAYAAAVYDAYTTLTRRDPLADVLLCGDFNDEPDDPSLQIDLHAVDDPGQVRAEDHPSPLLDLVAKRDPRVDGSYFYNGRWEFLDHVLIGPGLMDPNGWLVVPGSMATANFPALRSGRSGAPWRFGGPTNDRPRGPSDHFALTVRLKLAAPPTH